MEEEDHFLKGLDGGGQRTRRVLHNQRAARSASGLDGGRAVMMRVVPK